MKSNLSYLDFKERLSELTSEEKSFYFITAYNLSGKPFCGIYDDSKFELTRNSFWRHTKAITIKGEYKQLDDKSTNVAYQIGWSKSMKNLLIVFNIVAFIGVNIFITVNSDHMSASLSSTLLAINGFLLFANLWIFIVNAVLKRIINQRFKEEFEIGVEDEWEKLSKTIVRKQPSY